MKRLTLLLMLLFVALVSVTPAAAESPYTFQIPDAAVTRFSAMIAPATADTLYFTATSPRTLMDAATRANAWYKPADIPIAADAAGNTIVQTRRARGVFLAAKQPFWFRVYYPGAINKNADKTIVGVTYVTVDSCATVAAPGPASTRGDKYPCRALITGYPDSVIVKGCASGDSVRVFVGY